MTKVFFENVGLESVECMVNAKGLTSKIINRGATGGVDITYDVNMALSLEPQPNIPTNPEAGQQVSMDLEGKFVVEVNGVLIPHYFDATNLPKYFNANSGNAIEITVAADTQTS